MTEALHLEIQEQPDDTACGPTCLHAVYRYYGDDIALGQVMEEAGTLKDGGTLAVLLGCHALGRGYRATIYTFNLLMFDPTWFENGAPLSEKLQRQAEVKHDARLQEATPAYLQFLDAGGSIRFEDLSAGLLRRYLNRATPILTGLSATYLYRSPREYGAECENDDLRGSPVGHFVVVCGYRKRRREVLVADPWRANPLATRSQYWVDIGRLLNSVLLGIVTYDANLLVIEPARGRKRPP